jgi:two-component system, NtrC family, sensor kinase
MEIMIVDDDRISRRQLEKIVAELGHTYIIADNEREAWEKYQQNPVPVVITDWMMPDMDGLDFCRKLRSNTNAPNAYVITLISRAQKTALLEVLASGADDFVAKPFDPQELKARIKTSERIVNLNATLEDARTRLEATQDQIMQQEKMASIGQLAAGVAHEINNPTGFVSSNLKILEDYFVDINQLVGSYQQLVKVLVSEPLRKTFSAETSTQLEKVQAEENRFDIDFVKEDITDLLHDCRVGARRIKKIVLDLKAFAHPGEDKPQMADINKGIQATLNVVNNEIKYKATVSTDFGKLPMLRCYAQELNQVFMNILVNAAQAMKESGTIVVRTYHADDQIFIEISDNGVGIHPDNINRIFDPFFTTKDVGKGTGLGMHIAYNIIQKHKGTIRVESTLGQGTTFIIRLPVLGEGEI